MYIPEHFRESRPEVLHQLIRDNPLGILVTQQNALLDADHLPFELDAGAGLLRAHVARANPVWKELEQGAPFMLQFQGPEAYISPNWYEGKQKAGKVVPTWNYAVVHAHCSLHAIHDPEQVRQLVTQLTDQHEASQAHPWRVADAPTDYTDKLLANIVGIELRVHRMQGKWKVSQNQSGQNQQSVVQGLLSEGADAQTQMASLVKARGGL